MNEEEMPSVQFQFRNEPDKEIDKKEELRKLFQKRNEILASIGKPPIPIPEELESKDNPRQR